MQTIRQRLEELAESRLASSGQDQEHLDKKISDDIVANFLDDYDKKKHIEVSDVKLCETPHDELEHLLEQESSSVGMTLLVLMVILCLTGVQVLLLQNISLIVIPFFVSVNVALLLIGYLAAEYRHIERLEKNKRTLKLTDEIVQDFYEFTEDLKKESRVTEESGSTQHSHVSAQPVAAQSEETNKAA